MKQTALLIIMLLALASCEKNTDEITFDYSYTLEGDTNSEFNEKGESRKFTLSISREKRINGIPSGQKEPVRSSDIKNIRVRGPQFSLVNEEVTNKGFTFELLASENETDSIPKGELQIFVANGQGITSSDIYTFTQRASQIRYQYQISTEMAHPFYIPATGGKFEVPFLCKRSKYLNGNFINNQPIALKGLRYYIRLANSALVHSVFIIKDGESTGHYKFKIESVGPYNLFSWKKNDSVVRIEILNNKEMLFSNDIIQPQTDGEDISFPLVSNLSTGLFDI